MSRVRFVPVAPALACRDDCRPMLAVGARGIVGLAGADGDPPCPRCLRALRAIADETRLQGSMLAVRGGKRPRRAECFDACGEGEVLDRLAPALSAAHAGRDSILWIDAARRPRLGRVLAEQVLRLAPKATLVHRLPREHLVGEVLETLCTPADRADSATLLDADLVLLWGDDPWGGVSPRDARLARALEGVPRVLVVDPSASPSARRADLWMAPRPGTDGAVALAMTSLLAEPPEGDLDARVSAWRAEARGWSAERASRVSGVSAGVLADATRALGAARRPVVIAGPALASYPEASTSVAAVWALARSLGAPLLYRESPRDPTQGLPPAAGGRAPRRVASGDLASELSKRDAARDLVVINGGDPLEEMPHAAAALESHLRGAQFVVVFASRSSTITAFADVVVSTPAPLESPDVVGLAGSPAVWWIAERGCDPPRTAIDPARLWRLAARRAGAPEAWISDTVDSLVATVLERSRTPLNSTAPGGDVAPRYAESGQGPVTTPSLKATYSLAMIAVASAEVAREPLAVLSAEDARRRRVMADAAVLVFNEKGRVRARAVVDERQPPGTVALLYGSSADPAPLQAALGDVSLSRGESPGWPLVEVASADAV